jgi:hypothetical protein
MTLVKVLERSYYVGMALLFAGIVMAILEKPYALYFYALGLLPVLGVRIFNFVVSKPENKRMYMIMVMSGAALAAAGAGILMKDPWWIVFIAISASLDFYISFRRFR